MVPQAIKQNERVWSLKLSFRPRTLSFCVKDRASAVPRSVDRKLYGTGSHIVVLYPLPSP